MGGAGAQDQRHPISRTQELHRRNLRQRTKTLRRARCLLKIAPQQAEAEPDHLITSNRFGVIARASFWPSSLTITGP